MAQRIYGQAYENKEILNDLFVRYPMLSKCRESIITAYSFAGKSIYCGRQPLCGWQWGKCLGLRAYCRGINEIVYDETPIG